MEKQLQILNYPGLILLDTLSIALPRFPFNDIVCVDHFLCNDEPRGFVSTPTGIAIANEVLTAACNLEMQMINSTFQDGGLYKLFNLTVYNYYTLEGGCLRQIPNELNYTSSKLNDPTIDLLKLRYNTLNAYVFKIWGIFSCFYKLIIPPECVISNFSCR
jgi:hypothetical protein